MANYWKQEDKDRLRELFEEGKSDDELARALKRSKDSIIGMRFQLRLTRRTVTKPFRRARPQPATAAPSKLDAFLRKPFTLNKR